MNPKGSEFRGTSELTHRILSGLVMASVAIGVTIFGGWPFALIWLGASVAIAYEWQRLVHKDNALVPALLAISAVVLAASGAFWLLPKIWIAALAVVVLASFVVVKEGRVPTAVGVVYAALFCAAVFLCRGYTDDGMIVIFWLFAVVWGTDILAYFTGRSLGGPKLWPRVSPKKTWSGAIGGLSGGVLLGCLVLFAFGVSPKLPHVVLSVLFSVLTQSGDLFESAVKRRYNVKDSGSLIPGHGGFMDRLDGFIFAAIFAAIFGFMRGGLTGVPSGLIHWQ
jgi:phosphatidate cytidylyltransferase